MSGHISNPDGASTFPHRRRRRFIESLREINTSDLSVGDWMLVLRRVNEHLITSGNVGSVLPNTTRQAGE